MLIEFYRRIFSLFDARERRRFLALTAVMALVALAEVMGISMVLLLLKVLADPDIIDTDPTLEAVYDHLGFTSTFAFQVVLALAVTLVVFLGLTVKAGGTYAIIRFSTMRGYTISSRLLASYLHRPYAWFLERNSADVGKNVLGEVDGLVARVITPALRIMANVLLALTIVGFLLFVDPVITLLAAALLGGSYALIYLYLRERLRLWGEDMMISYAGRFRLAQEATGGIKEVKLLGLEESYTQNYAEAARRTASTNAKLGVMSELPRFALEALTFGTLLMMVLLLLFRTGGDIAATVPTLGIFAFSVMRLLPALQQIYHGLATMRGARAVLETIATDYVVTLPEAVRETEVAKPLRLDRVLEIRGLEFRYASAARPVLTDLNLAIAARTTVGFVGGTGAGKTTLVDLILGLLAPDAGEMCVDGTPVTPENLRTWQKTLGYVPQTIYLTDDTVAANIAFGVPKDEIDIAAVERAARAAALHDFVLGELPLGYATTVGERGVRLSGGQRQRIGIARALYRNPTLLIMDEATSALDTLTERAVMEAVQNIRADTTIVLIAHRLTTVKACDRIFLMEKGRIVASGTYDELVAGSETFRKMASGI